jgi:hypothetical protein
MNKVTKVTKVTGGGVQITRFSVTKVTKVTGDADAGRYGAARCNKQAEVSTGMVRTHPVG